MPDGTRRLHWSSGWFRALLALYPGEFRDEYGRELALVFADRYRDAAGPGDRVLIVLEAITGVLKEAPKEHLAMILQDLRYACRVLLRMPGFAATAILTLALGIGANTAIFQLIDAVRLRPLPIRSPGELARIQIVGGNGGFGLNPGQYGGLTTPIWRELESHQQAFSGMFAWSAWTMGVGDRSDLRRVSGLRVSGGFFRVLGIDAWRGRLIEPADETTCPSPRVVLSHAYWQRELGGRELDRSARLMVNGQSHEVIGVTPPGFFGVAVGETFDIAVPQCRQQNPRRDVFDVAVMARLRPGWTLDRASAHVNTLSGGIFEATAPTGYGTDSIERFKQFRLEAVSAATGVSTLRAQYDTSLQLLLGITGLVLLLACANLANLMLARALVRQREFSVRLALGASRTRLVRQSLAESAVLSACGAVVGIVLAQFLSRVLVWSLAAEGSAPALTLAASWRMLAFTGAVTILTCLFFGLAPALRSMRIQPATVMQVGGRAMTAGERFSIQRAMVVTQIAVSVVLLVGALLFVRSFRNIVTFDAGLRQQGVTVAYIGFDQLKVERDALNDVQRQILAEIRGIPGVVSAGSTSNVALMGSSWEHGIHVGTIEHSSKFTWVSPGYFETMNIPILQGRDFTLADTTGSPRVAVVNQTFVRRFVPDGQAIGRKLRTGAEPNYPSTEYEIVGVIPDTQYDTLRNAPPAQAFAPDSQSPAPGPWTSLMIHSTIDHAATVASVKRRLAASHPGSVVNFMDFQARIRGGLVRERLLAMLAGFFGALAALLAMIGLYGMMSFAMVQRQHEIGIRVALGAPQSRVVLMVMREAGWLLTLGIAAGAAMSLLAGQSATTLLFNLEPNDPATLAAACVLLTLIAALASFLPARRAARLDPLVALRQE
jgi:predicted permease